MTAIFERSELADELAQRLLAPTTLDIGLRSGLFISGLRRTGKTTFVRHDLIPALEERGAVVVYVDLWSDVQSSPMSLLTAAVKTRLEQMQAPVGKLVRRLGRVKKAGIEAVGVKFGFELDTIGAPGGPTLAQAMSELVDKAKRDVVLIVDEVQQALATDDGQNMMLAVKASRDAVNPRPKTPGFLFFIGTGSHRALVGEMAARRNQAFAGAVSVDFPLLGREYVDFVLERLAREGLERLPKAEAVMEAFEVLGRRPEELVKALRLTMMPVEGRVDARAALPAVARTLRAEAAGLELMKVDQMGRLASALFARVAAADDAARGLFGRESLSTYEAALGRTVSAEEVQRVLNALVEANLVMRRGHGLYELADPFVRTIIRERDALLRMP